MSYLNSFEHSFMEHTLALVSEYEGAFDATLLVNCLLGLLIVPRERHFERIPEDPIDELEKWGIRSGSVKSFGRRGQGAGEELPTNLRQLVRGLRNAVAHFRLMPIPENGLDVTGFKFTDESGFHAEVSLQEMRELTTRLAEHLNRM